MKKKKIELNPKYLILIVIIIFLLIINLVLFLKRVLIPKQQEEQAITNSVNNNNKNKTKEYKVPQSDEEIKAYLATLKEGNRIEYYCGKFIKLIDEKEYEKAYKLLYSEFKQNYFPTIEDFIKYVENFYPESYALEYDDIDRYNNIYVIRLKILDYNSSPSDEPKVQRVVIRENDYNDYVVSFQVVKEAE